MNKQHIKQHLERLTTKNVLIVDESDLLAGRIVSTHLYDIMIFDYATTYSRHIDELNLVESLTQLNLTMLWIIITSNFMYYKSNNPRVIYYPIYLIDGIDKCSWLVFDIQKSRPYNLSFLTYHLHWHRLLSLISLYKQKWFDTCLVNLLPINQMNTSQLQGYRSGALSLNSIEIETMNELFKLAPLIADTTDDQREIVNIQNRAFSHCYINMFTESDYCNLFITEKSIKPFLSGQFTAVMAHKGVYTHLQDLGFDLFQEYINLEFNIIDINDARNAINNVIDQISKLLPNIEQVWNDTYIRRKHNYELAISSALRSELCRELTEQLNKDKETI